MPQQAQRAQGSPEFLALAPVSPKPRSARLTRVLDKGVAPGALRTLLARFGAYIDIWKLGWGTAYLDPDLPEKLEILDRHGVRACVGGTLLEAAWVQGRAADCLAWYSAAGLPMAEVSDGATDMPLTEKRRLITTASRSFTVLAEVGSKHPAAPLSPDAWAQEMTGDLEAGATWVITEGREHGDVGLFTSEGRVRQEEAERFATLVAAKVGLSRVVVEAPGRTSSRGSSPVSGPTSARATCPRPECSRWKGCGAACAGDTIHLLTSPQPAASGTEEKV
jgi:phosphosulfolactate synthase